MVSSLCSGCDQASNSVTRCALLPASPSCWQQGGSTAPSSCEACLLKLGELAHWQDCLSSPRFPPSCPCPWSATTPSHPTHLAVLSRECIRHMQLQHTTGMWPLSGSAACWGLHMGGRAAAACSWQLPTGTLPQCVTQGRTSAAPTPAEPGGQAACLCPFRSPGVLPDLPTLVGNLPTFPAFLPVCLPCPPSSALHLRRHTLLRTLCWCIR